MPVILPFLALLGIAFGLKQSFKNLDGRFIILLSAAVWGVLLTLFTEILSLLHLFARPALSITWGATALITGIWAAIKWQKPKLALPARLNLLQYFQIFTIFGIAGLTAILALVAAPNNWDSMVYHLSRVAHWIQNSSVGNYPTATLWQLYHPAYAEYQIAHLQILSGGDLFAQVPQWLSMLGSVLGISLVAKQLGARLPGQIFAAFVTATIPMGILQSTTTQNDYVLAFWLVCLAAFILEALHRPHPGWHLAIGASLGLALLTKSTGYLFALPFMLYYGICGMKRARLRFAKAVLIITVIALALNLPHFSRNYSLFHSPFGPVEELARHQNTPINVEGTFSNIIRNLGLYVGTVEPVNQWVNSGIARLYGWLGMQVNDPRFTLADHTFLVKTPQVHEDTTGSSLHLLLAVSAFIILVAKRKKQAFREFIVYALLVLSAFLLFCVLLRWQIWHARLHLPLLVLSAAWIGLLSEVVPRRLVWGISVILAVFVLPVFYFNPNKPLIADYTIFNLPRREVMLMRKNLVVPYIEGVNYLVKEKNCFQVGLYIPNAEWEYPFWSLYADTGVPYRLEQVNVNNVSKDIPVAPFSPCAVIATQSTGEQFTLEGDRVYELTWSMDPVYVYTK